MNNFLQIIKKIPWWGWIAEIVIVLILWQSLSGWAYSRKLYNMALDNLRTDQSRVIKTLEDNMQAYEKEILTLQQQVEINKKQQTAIRAENEKLKGLIYEKDEQIVALRKERNNWVVPGDPNVLMDELRKRGLRPTIRN